MEYFSSNFDIFPLISLYELPKILENVGKYDVKL